MAPGPAHAVHASRSLTSQGRFTKTSVRAATFLVLYVVVYLTVGFAGLAVIDWVWAAIFQ
jgi:hypothetical protein